MQKELYFDVVSEEGAGGLYRLRGNNDGARFTYHYSSADLETDKVITSETSFDEFAGFWNFFVADPLWFCLHPLYIHPDQRAFVKQQLAKIDWNIVRDEKWREMYQRQWNKVLTNPAAYYSPDRPNLP